MTKNYFVNPNADAKEEWKWRKF